MTKASTTSPAASASRDDREKVKSRRAEKARPAGNEIGRRGEPERGAAGGPPEPLLRENRVHADENGEGDGEGIGDVKPKGQPAGAKHLESDSGERDAEENLLPGLDSSQSAAAKTGAAQRRHDRVVRGEAHDPRIHREDRLPPTED